MDFAEFLAWVRSEAPGYLIRPDGAIVPMSFESYVTMEAPEGSCLAVGSEAAARRAARVAAARRRWS